ncbi:hypothetical protein J6590_097711 [Homalodisca vitripennis]|nr:hypothetical protein J6590_055205 [Homalodisca vitripennis]KAG8334102.1 hypothetical protein J6590_097711 [Homalodisca vitripennis]
MDTPEQYYMTDSNIKPIEEMESRQQGRVRDRLSGRWMALSPDALIMWEQVLGSARHYTFWSTKRKIVSPPTFTFALPGAET